jgi:hypothetical protein
MRCLFGYAFAVSDPTGPEIYRFNPLYGYTEMVDDDGRSVTEPGQSGRIVSTGLIFRGMPLLRYDTGDTAELIEVASAENGWRMAVGRITPKQGNEWLVGRTGVLISVISPEGISEVGSSKTVHRAITHLPSAARRERRRAHRHPAASSQPASISPFLK